MADQEILLPGEDANVDAVLAALGRADVLQRRLKQTNTELVRCFDTLGFALRRLGLLDHSEFWQQHGPLPAGTQITRSR